MLHVMKSSFRTAAYVPSTLYLLVDGAEQNIFRVCKCITHVNFNFQSFRAFVPFCLISSNRESFLLERQNKCIFNIKFLSTMSERILVQARDPGKLSMDILTAIEEHRLNDTWQLFQQHMQIEGFPRKSVINRLITGSVQSLQIQWLEKAYDLVEQAFSEGKQNLLDKDPLIYLSFGLAKSGLPVPACTILRKLIKMEQFLPVAAWSAILAYMSQTAPGAYLGAELILEIGYLFQDGRVDPRKKTNAPLVAMKPNTISFNIALAGCLLFGTTRKAEELLDMMPRVGVKVDANLLMVIVHIHERNGRREELKKLQRHIDESHNLNDVQFRQFYSSLLTCHLKFGDLESASNMVLDMLRKAKIAKNTLGSASLVCISDKNVRSLSGAVSEKAFIQQSDRLEGKGSNEHSIISYEAFVMDKDFLKLDIEAKEVLGTLLAKLQLQVELISTKHGILQPTETIFVKLVRAFLEAGKTKDLAQFLIQAEKEESPVSNDDLMLVHVINACISLGWLDQAYDLLDEMNLAGVRTSSSVYGSLLKAFCETNRTSEIACLLRDARKAGIQLDSSCYDALIKSRVLQNDNQGALSLFQEMKEAKIPRSGHQEFKRLVENCAGSGEVGLMEKLLQEIKDGQKPGYGVHDWNNVIHFFCKKRLMQDAEKALKKMRSLGHAPNAQTFHSMVTGYAAIGGKYIEVTELWGEMKSIASASFMKFDQELLDSVLYTFVRGGFFVRANEVVEMMEKDDIFIDKFKYRTLFLKYHKTLYKGKAPKFQTEAQLRKRESALSFKKWVGLY